MLARGSRLSICRNITEALGGRIEVTSEVGVGSMFSVSLPYSAQRSIGLSQPSSHPPAQTTRSLRVLVVDDDVFVARSIRRLLRPQHDVTLALSGRQALGLIRDSDYDVIFCDVMMPEMTGMELHAAVSRQNIQLSERFVFITGGPFTPEARSCSTPSRNLASRSRLRPGPWPMCSSSARSATLGTRPAIARPELKRSRRRGMRWSAGRNL